MEDQQGAPPSSQLSFGELIPRYSQFSPFDPESKRITAEVEKDGKHYTCAKGAPNAILRLADFPKDVASHYRATAASFASRGFRSLGVAIKEEGQEWELLGLLSMSDPPRHDTPSTVREAQELGIQIKMLTGDATAIAKETCKQLALGANVYDSERLLGGAMSGSEQVDFLEAADGFACVPLFLLLHVLAACLFYCRVRLR